MSRLEAEGAEVWCIVLAAGRGSRFGGPKQWADVEGERLVDRVVRTASAACDHVVVVLPPGQAWDGPPVEDRVDGGAERADSVRAGLASVPDGADVVVVADAAHPLAGADLFRALIDAVLAGADGAVPVLPMLEIVQRVEEGRVVATLPKEGTCLTQMPHAFRAHRLRRVHADAPRVVDDSTLLVESGMRVVPVPGQPWNLHVGTPVDLEVLRRLSDLPVVT